MKAKAESCANGAGRVAGEIEKYLAGERHDAEPGIKRDERTSLDTFGRLADGVTLAQAADAEKADTDASAYLLSAAFALNANPARRSAWRSALEQVLANGSMDARFEACNGLVQQATLASLAPYVPLLDDPGADTRVGAAMTILYVRARE